MHSILRENLERANAGGLNELRPQPKRRSRRKRDYIAGMILGNLVLAVVTAISAIFGLAGIIIFNCGFTWVVWGVMDDY